MTLLSELREGLRISIGAVLANKLRSGLTTLGIIIGILTVSLMAMAIEGLHAAFLRSVSALGSDVFYIEKFPWESGNAWWKYRTRRDFSLQDGKRILEESTQAMAVSAEASSNWPVKYKDRSAQGVWICGNNEQSALVRQLTVKEGRFLSEADVNGARPVCVLGAEIADKLFPHESPIGKRIQIASKNVEVIGVNEKFGQFLFGNMDHQVIIPITRFMTDYQRYPYVFFMVKVRDATQMEEAREELRGVVRKIRRVPPDAEDDFAINQQDMVIQTFNRVGGIIASVGLFITGLSLFVGGIGIMNIMFVSVAERTREIGIRKAIGARRRTILLQFLIEAMLVCLFGGLIGLAIAYPASLGLKKLMPTSISMTVIGIAIFVSLITGVAAGFMPAWRAARMNPVDALRAE
jgi:putative ABC transport system permease protein